MATEALSEVFMYNRENFRNDAEQRQERTYTGYEMRAEQVFCPPPCEESRRSPPQISVGRQPV